MKSKFLYFIVTVFTILTFPKVNFGQAIAPDLGTTVNFAIFSSAGAVKSTSIPKFLTHITGQIGSAPASITGFGNVDGVEYQGGTEFNTATVDLQAAYLELNGLTPTDVLATPFGGGNTLFQGVYNVGSASQLNGELILDALGDPDAVFIFQLQGAFSVAANSKIKLINGALACKVFWKVEGAVDIATGANMKGTIIANNDFINMSVNDTLEGRALAINGAVTVKDVLIYLPKGCGSTVLSGPIAPTLAGMECYAIFSSDGQVTDDFGSFITGDVGTNGPGDLTTGYDNLKVTGTVHPIPDGSTNQCATDLGPAYSYINTLQHDILLLEPTLFGNDLVLTPHTYRIDGAVTFTDTLYLNAEGNADAVFIIKVYGAFGSSTNSRVKLINGAQAKNVYWMINGAVSIGVNSVFNGTFVSAGAIDLLLGTTMNGRAFTTVGDINTYSINAIIPTGRAAAAGAIAGENSVCQGETLVIYSVPPIAGATSYIWTLPAGATITPSTSSTGNSISVDFSAGATNGNITVEGGSSCANGTVSANFPVTVNATPTVNNVSNQGPLCNNDPTTLIDFDGSNPGATYNWTNDNMSIGLPLSGNTDIASFTVTNTGTLVETATIIVTPTANGCPGVSKNFTITVNPIPTISPVANQGRCNNTSTSTIVFVGGVAGTIYNWTNDNTSIGLAANGSGDINSFIATNTGSGVEIANIIVTPTANGCNGLSESFAITASPTPDVNSIANQAPICNNANTIAILFSGTVVGATYDWTNDNPSIGLLANGSGDIASFTGINTGTVIETANIVISPVFNGCNGVTKSFTMTVNPLPTTNSIANQGVCSNSSTTDVIFTGGVTGTVYNWTNDNTSIGLVGSGTGDILSFTATNTSANTVTAIITILPTANACDGLSSSFTISASPVQTVNSVPNQTLCNNATTSAIVFSGGAAGTIYNWTNDNASIGLAASGNTDIAAFTASNSGTVSIGGIVTVLPILNGCGGAGTSFSMTVKPTPTVASIPNQELCNEVTTSAILFTGGVAGTTYNWTNDNSSIGLSANGSGNIDTFKAINSGSGIEVATITATPTANGCDGTPTSTTITVNNCVVIVNDFFIPEGFSPNGDGTNDLFVIRGIERFPNNTFNIFNRWGDKILGANSYLNTWDGTSTSGVSIGGNELPIGTYFYTLDLGDGTPIYKGTIYLNK